MSLFNQENNSFLGIDRSFPQVVDWCQDCDYYGGEWVKDAYGFGSGRQCTGPCEPHLVDGTPVGDVKPVGHPHAKVPSHFMEKTYFRCDKRSTLQLELKEAAREVMDRISGAVCR